MASVHRQLLSRARNGLLRPGADPEYADGDDASWMQVDWPALTRRVTVGGAELNVVDTGGDGPPLLWIHGINGMWQNWLLNIPAFMGAYRCVAPDLPGFGGSEMPRGEISIRGYAEILDALCDGLGIESPTVIAHSMGGFIGAELAISQPTRVQRLVLVSAAGLSTEYLLREPLLAGARLWAMVTSRTGARADPVVRRARLRRMALQTVVRYPEKLSQPLAWELVQGADRPGFLPALEAILRWAFRDRLARIEVPTLIVWGANDVLVPVEDADEFERLIGVNARKVVFHDTGHLPMLERPSRFNALVEGFLAGERRPEHDVEGVSE